MRNCSTFKGTIQKKANWRSCKLFKTPPITHYFVTLPRCVHIVKKSHKPTLKCGPLPANKHSIPVQVLFRRVPSQNEPNSDRTCTIVQAESSNHSHSILTELNLPNLNSLTKTELHYSIKFALVKSSSGEMQQHNRHKIRDRSFVRRVVHAKSWWWPRHVLQIRNWIVTWSD